MIPRPTFEDAPGLTLKPMKGGWRVRWRARKDLVARGFEPKNVILWAGIEPTHVQRLFVSDRCRDLQAKMLVWGSEGISKPAQEFDGTLGALVNTYLTDKASGFHKKEYCTRRYYERMFNLVVNGHKRGLYQGRGPTRIADIKTRNIIVWHDEWSEEGARISMGNSMIAMLRIAVNFGAGILDNEDCERVCGKLHRMHFENAKPRTVRIMRDQVVAICDAARAAGLPMVALAQTIQFDFTWRQKDVLGEWIPVSERPFSTVLDGNMKWLKGLRWEEIDADFIVHHITSKRKKLSEPDLKLAPLVLGELARMWPGCYEIKKAEKEGDADKIIPHREVLPANGPVIIDQHRGIPYYADDFRAEWRKLAAECGVPLNVQNRDSRAGAISEAIAMGANAAHVRDAATHSSVEQTYEYSRAGRENTATVQELRARKSKKNVA